MKKTNYSRIIPFLTLLFFISVFSSYGQVVSISPENATADDNNVVLTYDASMGNKALLGANDIYVHTGVITDQSTSSSDWKYVIADWSLNITKAIAVRIGTSNLYNINIGNIRNFYGVPSGVKILRLAMVFRNSNGTLVGAGQNLSDIYLSVNKGKKWQEKSFNNEITCLANDRNGNIFAGTQDSAGNAYVALWNGKNWNKLGGNFSYLYPFVKLQGKSYLNAITSDINGNIYAAGYILNNGRPDVAKWNGNSWTALLGTNNGFWGFGINTIAVGSNGKVYVAGNIQKVTGSSQEYFTIAEWDGNNWNELGGSMASMFNSNIYKIAFDAAGNLYAAGNFTNQNGHIYIAKWNGSNWSELGGTDAINFMQYIKDFYFDKTGNLYAKGYGATYKWNGINWSTIINDGPTSETGYVNFVDNNNNIYLTSFEYKNSNFDKFVKKYDGVSITELGGTNAASPINGDISDCIGDIYGNIYVAYNTLNDNFAIAKYFNNPQINSFTPLTAAKGEKVTIIGRNLNGVTMVNFGSDTCLSFNIVNDSTIMAFVGSGASGNVIVTNPGGNAVKPGFTFIPAPKIISVSPMKAPTGATVTIIGNNFNNSNFVKFGGTASVITVVSSTIITAKIGTGSSGFVCVQTPGGLDSIDGFNFIPAPKITLFTPTSAKAGETVIIIGTDFNEANNVSFGGISAKSFSVLTSNTITAIIDTGNGGSVKVTTPGGTDSITGFIYIPVKTGLLELQNNQIKIFPNPAKETITIKSELNLNGKVYCIYDLLGNSLLTGKLFGELNTIPINELKNGVYIVSIFDSNNELTTTIKISVIK